MRVCALVLTVLAVLGTSAAAGAAVRVDGPTAARSVAHLRGYPQLDGGRWLVADEGASRVRVVDLRRRTNRVVPTQGCRSRYGVEDGWTFSGPGRFLLSCTTTASAPWAMLDAGTRTITAVPVQGGGAFAVGAHWVWTTAPYPDEYAWTDWRTGERVVGGDADACPDLDRPGFVEVSICYPDRFERSGGWRFYDTGDDVRLQGHGRTITVGRFADGGGGALGAPLLNGRLMSWVERRTRRTATIAVRRLGSPSVARWRVSTPVDNGGRLVGAMVVRGRLLVIAPAAGRHSSGNGPYDVALAALPRRLRG